MPNETINKNNRNDVHKVKLYNAEHICIVGDMNTDISRSHSRHTGLL